MLKAILGSFWALLFIGLVIHNFLIIFSLLPANPISIRYANESVAYSNIIAPQQWFFFTPVDTNSYSILVRYQDNNSWDDYENLLHKNIKRHQANLLGRAEKELYLHTALSRSIAMALEKAKKEHPENSDIFFKQEPIYTQVNNMVRYYGSGKKMAQWSILEQEAIPFSLRNTQHTPKSAVIYESPQYVF